MTYIVNHRWISCTSTDDTSICGGKSPSRCIKKEAETPPPTDTLPSARKRKEAGKTSTKRSFSIKKTTTDKGVACGERPGKANVTNQAWYVMKRTRWRVGRGQIDRRPAPSRLLGVLYCNFNSWKKAAGTLPTPR